MDRALSSLFSPTGEQSSERTLRPKKTRDRRLAFNQSTNDIPFSLFLIVGHLWAPLFVHFEFTNYERVLYLS
jgi:hypothetical protein